MNKILIAALFFILVTFGGYSLIEITKEMQDKNIATYTIPGLGFEFKYPTGSEGYVTKRKTYPTNADELTQTITLLRAQDEKNPIPEGADGPPAINILIFENSNKEQATNWINNHPTYSNITLKTSDVTEAVVGGANAVRYSATGLYESHNTVVAHGENMYMITTAILDSSTKMYDDYEALVASIRFIPRSGQE